MSKFSSPEVDALRQGGNQRARELFLETWGPSDRYPDNSNVENIREFIKNAYVIKMYSIRMSSNKPTRDPKSLRSQEDEARRASSFRSYSRSPSYDSQYGKPRNPGPNLGYEGKLTSFLHPTHSSDAGFVNEGSNPRAFGCSVSGGGDPFQSEAVPPVSQRNFGNPSSETSGDISGGSPQSSNSLKRNAGKTLHLQRPVSTGSFGSIDSNFGFSKSVSSLPKAGTGPAHSAEISIKKSSSFPTLPVSSTDQTFDEFDLFGAPFVANTINKDLQSTQQLSQIPETQPLDFFDILSQQHPSASFNEKDSDVVTPHNVGWATFDVPQNVASAGTENSSPLTKTSFDGNVFGTFNPFNFDPSLQQNPSNFNPFLSTNPFVHGNQQSVPAAVTDLWNVFGNSTEEQLSTNFLRRNEQDAKHGTLDSDKSFDFGAHEVDTSIVNQAMTSDFSFRTTNEAQPFPSSLSSHFSVKPNESLVVSAAPQMYSFAANLRPTNPFDTPFGQDVESRNVVWDLSSLEGALPTGTHTPPVSNVEVNTSWFTENLFPAHAPIYGEVLLESTTGQAPNTSTNKLNRDGKGPVTSAGGNPFA